MKASLNCELKLDDPRIEVKPVKVYRDSCNPSGAIDIFGMPHIIVWWDAPDGTTRRGVVPVDFVCEA